MNAEIFRQYDIRGVVETDLTPDVVETLGKAFGSCIRDEGGNSIVLGRDGRTSGSGLRDSFVKGARSAGVNVIDIGMVPTPVLYFATYYLNPDGAVQITGSHNPPEFNGFKMMIGKRTVFGEMIQDLYKRIQAGNFQNGEGEYETKDVLPAYLETITKDITLKRPVKIALDSGNGVGGLAGPKLFHMLECEPLELFSEVDGTFPNHHPDPTIPENLEDVKKAVLTEGLECGIAYDGDADRIGVIDDKGNVLWGDRLLSLYSRYVLKEHPGATIIGEVKCSKALYDDVAKHGGNPIMWKTGHSFLKAKLREEDAKLAGEMSGHMFFNDRYFGYDDAIYASARLAEILASEDRPLSELLADLPLYPSTPEIRIDCADDKKFKLVEEVAKHFKSRYDVVDIDGVRVNFEHGWGLLRASNTQPVLVMRFEADTEERMQKYRDEVEGVLKEVQDRLA